MSLPAGFLDRPVAHRGLHDATRPENGLAAIRAAAGAGYGIEIDMQPSADGIAMAFHDGTLDRMTAETGPVRSRTAEALGRIALGRAGETIPTLAAVLSEIAGRVPLVIEMKDQSGALAGSDGVLEAGVARSLDDYAGPAAVMSFNPDMVARLREIAPDLPRGLVTAAFGPDWPLPAERRDRLRAIEEYRRAGAVFVSHEAADLSRPRLAELRKEGAAILCWTIRSPAEAEAARRVADQITFEGFRPP